MRAILFVTTLWSLSVLGESGKISPTSFTRGVRFVTHGGLKSLYEQNVTDLVSMSLACQRSVLEVQEGLSSSFSSWAHHFPDCISSAPSGLLSGTVTDFGEYDGCLLIKNPDAAFVDGASLTSYPFSGKYCMTEFVPRKGSSLDVLLGASVPALGFFNLTLGVCFPSTCSDEDIGLLLSSRFVRYTLDLEFVNQEKMSCDTAISVSYSYRLRHLDPSQVVSLTFLIGFVLLQLISTFMVSKRKESSSFAKDPIISCLSVTHNFWSLFERRHKKQTTFIDHFKVFMICMGISAHCMLCLDKTVPIAALREYPAI